MKLQRKKKKSEKIKSSQTTVERKFKRSLVDKIFISKFSKTKRAIKNECGGA